MKPTRQAEFARILGLWDAAAIVAGSMIGSGIFLVSADIARLLDAPVWLLAVWLATAAVTVVAALNYGELAAMLPRAGGQYVYLREAYGPLWGFLYGWTLFTVIQTGTIAAVAVAFAKFCAVFIPALEGSTAGSVGLDGQRCVAIGVIVLLTWANCRGLRTGRWIQNIFTVAKVGTLLAVVLAGVVLGPSLGQGHVNWVYFWGQRAMSLSDVLPLFGAAMVGALFSADAWNNITFAAAEVKHPERNIAASLVIGAGGVTVLYILANASYLAVLPLWGAAGGSNPLERGIQYANNDRVASAMMEVLFGSTGNLLMSAAIMVSTFGCANGLILSGARVYHAMAKDGLFFKAAGYLNVYRVPVVALVFQAAWAGILVLSGTYGDLLDYVIFAALLFYSLTVAAVVVLRIRHPQWPRPYRAIGYPWLTLLYVAATLAIMVDLLVMKPRYTWPGLLIVLAGVPVYYLTRQRRRASSLT
ncbi:MAG: amino acid transporter [Candidatus Binatia bacterium]|nr:MAG: amino acid transporter [Candidatus Binatia bacterium]